MSLLPTGVRTGLAGPACKAACRQAPSPSFFTSAAARAPTRSIRGTAASRAGRQLPKLLTHPCLQLFPGFANKGLGQQCGTAPPPPTPPPPLAEALETCRLAMGRFVIYYRRLAGPMMRCSGSLGPGPAGRSPNPSFPRLPGGLPRIRRGDRPEDGQIAGWRGFLPRRELEPGWGSPGASRGAYGDRSGPGWRSGQGMGRTQNQEEVGRGGGKGAQA